MNRGSWVWVPRRLHARAQMTGNFSCVRNSNHIALDGEGREKMRSRKPLLVIMALTISLVVSSMAFAGGYSGGHRGGYYRGGGHYGGYYRGGTTIAIGGPWWGPSWYYPSYYPYYSYPYYYPYSYAPVVTVPTSPPEYIERSEPAEDSPPSGVWYYCPDSKTYYPYVMECPGGWQTVPAEPSSEPRR